MSPSRSCFKCIERACLPRSFLMSEDRRSPTRTPMISTRFCLLHAEHNLQPGWFLSTKLAYCGEPRGRRWRCAFQPSSKQWKPCFISTVTGQKQHGRRGRPRRRWTDDIKQWTVKLRRRRHDRTLTSILTTNATLFTDKYIKTVTKHLPHLIQTFMFGCVLSAHNKRKCYVMLTGFTVHCLISSVQRLRGLPRRPFPAIMPCRICVHRLSARTTWPTLSTVASFVWLLPGNDMSAALQLYSIELVLCIVSNVGPIECIIFTMTADFAFNNSGMELGLHIDYNQ